jgi:hypothetical protein
LEDIPSVKRDDEELARSEFDQLLREQLGVIRPEWEEVDAECEPPDYYLSFDARRFAVEVTTVMEKVELQAGSYPSLAILATLKKTVDEIENRARADDFLRGCYVVSLSPLDDFYSQRASLIDGSDD